MADIRIEVYWSPDSKSALTVKDTDTVDHVIEQVRVRTGDQFRKDDDDGHRIIYSLFRVDDQADEALDRDGILHRIGLTDGAKLYLDRPGQMHWWRGIQVRLTDGCVVPVPNDGLRINRGYLLNVSSCILGAKRPYAASAAGSTAKSSVRAISGGCTHLARHPSMDTFSITARARRLRRPPALCWAARVGQLRYS